MKVHYLIILLLFSSCILGAQSKWPDHSFCDKEFFKHVFNRFKVEDEKDKVFDVIHILVKLDVNSGLSREVHSLNQNQIYLSIVDAALDSYTACFPEDGRLELILYAEKDSDFEKDVYESRIQKFKEKNNISNDVLDGMVVFFRRTSCGIGDSTKPYGSTKSPSQLISEELEKLSQPLKLKRN